MSEIKSTITYDCFKQITSNREVNQRHVRRLIKNIRENNMLHLNPIIVNEMMQVIDGQHRLEAATQLGLPIFYIIDGKVNKECISKLNSVSKSWTVMDYVNYWTIEKRPGFDKLSSFLSDNPIIPPSTALVMMNPEGRSANGLKDGVINIDNFDLACEIAGICKYYRNMIDFAYDRNFVLAVMECVKTVGYDHEIMKKKLEFQSRSLVKCINKRQYREMLEEIYNYKSSTNRLKFL